MIFEIFLGVLLFIEGYIIWNLNKKTELLETWVENFTQRVQKVQDDLKEVDSKGYFESDDDVGSIFERIKEIINELDNIKGDEIDAK
jgi:vacuolar-type H+-ATPase subunit E/Vma4|tara:strand:+ start:376 stop:636 length:261 start_codon:yes stop_codon:yes gene_type:complete